MLKKLIIKVDNQDIHLSPKLTVPTRQTNIPVEHCSFRSHKDIFWKVELLEYNPETKCWRMKVIDYSTNDTKNFDRQISTRGIERIAFEPFDWLALEPLLTSYKKSKLLDVLRNHDADRFFREYPQLVETPASSITTSSNQYIQCDLPQAQQNLTAFTAVNRQPIIEFHKVKFTVCFSDAHFMFGHVAFNKKIKAVGRTIEFKIDNDHIRSEFDAIKSWFARKLKTEKFKVEASITTSDGKVTEVTAISPQIAMIDAQLIDGIRHQRTIALTKPSRISETDKSLFTADEIFGEIKTDDIEGNVFCQNEQDILSFLLDNNKTRNGKQLEYLSGNKQADNSKIRFTLHPKFGFLFFIEGKEHNHFVWELLNSHATYIWSIDKFEKEIDYQYKRVEESINTIRGIGRERYKQEYRKNNHDHDLLFYIIKHKDVTSNDVDGFEDWKRKLNEKIT